MAVNEIGVRVKLDGEQQYKEQMRQIAQNTKLVRSETQQLESSWSKDTSAKQKATEQTELLNKQIERQNQYIATCKDNIQRYSDETGEGSAETIKWKNALAQAEAELNRMQSDLQAIPNDVELMAQKMKSAGQKLQSIGDGMQKVGKTMTTYVTAPIVGLGTLAVKTTADFDTSMSKVMALSGATGDEFQMLRDKARQMGSTTKYSAKESADALSYMALAGWDSEQMVDGLDGVLNLAAASGMDLAEASDLVTDYLSAFGLEASDSAKMADELAYAQAHSNTTTTQLGEAFGNSAAQMHNAGQSMETTTAILEAFANQGLKGSEAGTALSAMVRDLSKKMKNGKVMIGDTAVQVMDANGNFRDMTDILVDVEAATEGMGSAERDMALRMVFGDRSIKGVTMALTEGTGVIKGYRDELYKADGTAKNMADIMQDNLSGQLTMLKSQLQELGISFGDILVPQIRKAVEWIQKQVDKFNHLDSATKEQIVKFAALAAAIGPVLLVGGKLVSSIGGLLLKGSDLLKWLSGVAPGFASVVAAVGPVIGVFGLAAAGGAALGFAIKDLNEKYGATSAVNDFNNYVRGTADAAGEARENLEKSTEEIQKTSENAERVMAECELSADLTDRYAEELYELAGKTERTTKEQRRMEAIIDALNDIYPGFTQAVMDSNGELKMGVGELQDYIGELENMSRLKAIQSIIDEYTDDLVSATRRQIEAENALEDARNAELAAGNKIATASQSMVMASRQGTVAFNDYRSALTNGAFDMEKTNAAALGLQESFANLGNGTIKVDGETVKYSDTVGQLADSQTLAANEVEKTTKSIEEYKKEADDAQGEVDRLQGEVDKLKETLGLETEATEESTEATGENTAATSEAGDAYSEYAEDINSAAEELKKAQQEIRDSYARTYESAYDSIMGQKDLWDKVEEQEETSVDAMIEALASHEKALREWDQHSSGLLGSQLYQTNETFRNMVDSVIAGGEELAPELEVIYELWATGDERLYELIQHYGNTEMLAEYAARNTASAATAAEYGLEEFAEAIRAGLEQAYNEPSEILKNPTKLINYALEGNKQFVKMGMSAFLSGGKQVGGAAGTGISESTGEVEAGTEAVTTTAEAGVEKVSNLSDDAETAGKDVGSAIAKGARAERGEIDSAFTSLRTAVSTNITNIQNLKSAAKTAGMNLATNISDGITQMTKNVTTAMNGVKASVEAGINNIAGKKSDMLSTGQALGTSLATGLTNKSTEAYNAGVSIGNQLANGVGSTEGNARNKANNVANAVRNAISQADNADLYAWGNHMGGNFADGIASKEGAVRLAAQKLANAARANLHFTKPDEGPLKEGTEIWGKHLAENYASGMLQGVLYVRDAANAIASAVALPTSTVMDIDAVSGRNVQESLTLDGLFDVISAAVSNQEMTVQIGNREFARILREQGAIA